MEKAKVICDTDVMIDYLDPLHARHTSAKQFLEDAIELDFVTISAITKLELMRGMQNKVGLIKLIKNLNRFNILLINPEITSISLRLMESYKLSHNLAIPDCFIAATAIHTGFELFTYNVKDYKFISGLQLYIAITE